MVNPVVLPVVPTPKSVTPGPKAVPGTPSTLRPNGEPWDTLAPTLLNPCGIPDFLQTQPADMPLFKGM